MNRSFLLSVALASSAFAQAPAPSAPSVTSNNAAIIVTASGTQSLTLGETAILRAAVAASYPDLATAQATLTVIGAGIAAAHGVPAAGPYSITGDFSVQISAAPPVPPPPTWTYLAAEGATVTLKAGAVIRVGAKAGTRQWGLPTGTPLAADVWSKSITISTAGPVTVSIAALGIPDPAPGYYKEVDILQ